MVVLTNSSWLLNRTFRSASGPSNTVPSGNSPPASTGNPASWVRHFPIAEVGDELFADGGLYANAPDLLGLHESEHYFKVPAEEIRILSIGTTTSKFSFSHVGGNQYGILEWMRDQRLVNAILASQQMNSNFILRHKLGDRYVRIDALQSKEQERNLALDVATPEAQRTTRALAEAAVREFINNKTLREILAHRAPTPSFYQSNGRLKANSEEY